MLSRTRKQCKSKHGLDFIEMTEICDEKRLVCGARLPANITLSRSSNELLNLLTVKLHERKHNTTKRFGWQGRQVVWHGRQVVSVSWRIYIDALGSASASDGLIEKRWPPGLQLLPVPKLATHAPVHAPYILHLLDFMIIISLLSLLPYPPLRPSPIAPPPRRLLSVSSSCSAWLRFSYSASSSLLSFSSHFSPLLRLF